MASCGQTTNEPQKQISAINKEQIKASERPLEKNTITFQELNGRAVLIGEKINVLNDELKAITTLNESSIVDLTGFSDSLYQKTDDYCEAFRYVKINTDTQKGIVDGRNVYQLTESQQDTSFFYKDKNFEIKTTSFFGIGFDDDEGLTFCSKYYEPVVIINKDINQPSLIEIIENDISKKASWKDNFRYLELMANDGALDKIEKIEQTQSGIILTIKREFQEGWNEYQVEIKLIEERYQAEYLNYGEIKY